jgi:hypothetical protein
MEVQMSQHRELIGRFEQGAAGVEKALRGLPTEVESREPAPGKWSIRKIAAHIADAELVIAARVRWVAAEPGSPLKAYTQELWEERLGYDKRDASSSLELFLALRRSTAALLRNMPESAWSQRGIHEERGELTLADIVAGATEHIEQHAKQIDSIRTGAAAAA